MTEIKFTVLIVEDEENIGNFISTILKTNGYKPIIATTGTQAIQCAESYCPDIILLDLGLPDMDGIDVISEIRKWLGYIIICPCIQGFYFLRFTVSC